MAEVPTGKPDLSQVQTPAEFVDAMRRLKSWTGWGYRRLEQRAATAGDALPRSTLTVALTRQTLPREDLVMAFARACGCDEAETDQWVAARRRIAGGASPVEIETAAPRRIRASRVALATGVLAASAVAIFVTGLSAPTAPAPELAAPAQSPSQSQSASATPATATPTTTDFPPSTVSVAPSPGSPPRSSGGPIQVVGKPSASEAPRPVPNTTTVLTQLPPVPPPQQQPPQQPPPEPEPLPRCADVAWRHVGDRRVVLPSHSSSLDCVLSFGATGEGVDALQVSLIYCNNAKYVSRTGTYDQKTAEAIYFIQTASGNRANDGIYRPETRTTLKWVHHNGTDGTCVNYGDT
jgi:hypothetical protein